MSDLYTREEYNEDHPLSNYGTFLKDRSEKGYTTVQLGNAPWVDGLKVQFIASCQHEDGHVFAWQIVKFRDEQTVLKITSYPYGLNFKTKADFAAYCEERQMVLQGVTTLSDEIERVEKKASVA